MKYKNIALLTLGIILILFASIYLLTQKSFTDCWDLSQTGQIGDTIGGITAPVINIIGSILIYISFLEQNKANKIQANQNNFELLHELYKDIKEDFRNISFSSKTINNGHIYQGQKALSVFVDTLKSRNENQDFKKNSFFKDFIFFMASIQIFLEIVESSQVEEKQKKYILRLLHMLYITRISMHVNEMLILTSNELHSIFFNQLIKISQNIEKNHEANFKD